MDRLIDGLEPMTVGGIQGAMEGLPGIQHADVEEELVKLEAVGLVKRSRKTGFDYFSVDPTFLAKLPQQVIDGAQQGDAWKGDLRAEEGANVFKKYLPLMESPEARQSAQPPPQEVFGGHLPAISAILRDKAKVKKLAAILEEHRKQPSGSE
ncbi:MAG TPA: hypothetical protein VNZ52_07700 [Candidatus Thermoplasmatota archaeon]|nr:hypothetical protein [Candidatus Thermoplasmatota archaeon]